MGQRPQLAASCCQCSAGVVGVAEKDNQVICIEGVFEGVEVCGDLEDADMMLPLYSCTVVR